QAEDGIRGKLVTGVQTCALPISGNQSISEIPAGDGGLYEAALAGLPGRSGGAALRDRSDDPRQERGPGTTGDGSVHDLVPSRRRSEERRVGKESRYRQSTEHEME